jgi:hypothetical protein
MSDPEDKVPPLEPIAGTSLNEGSNKDDTVSAELDDTEEIYDDNDYIPDFIQELVDDPPILAGESKDGFARLFESFEMDYTQRPKTDLEYFWTYRATVATWEVMRYEHMTQPSWPPNAAWQWRRSTAKCHRRQLMTRSSPRCAAPLARTRGCFSPIPRIARSLPKSLSRLDLARAPLTPQRSDALCRR